MCLAKIAVRSIPACAGETYEEVVVEPVAAVYPRVCGGNLMKQYGDITTAGLSPRVRGKRPDPPAASSTRGSIPACAGETTASTFLSSSSTVYPRVCGGNGRLSSIRRRRIGLSPRVRGKRHLMVVAIKGDRSIPACAGETRRQPCPPARQTVYPRVCGGNAYHSNVSPAEAGLSPRVRGKPPRPRRHRVNVGSIPACAGETSPSR